MLVVTLTMCDSWSYPIPLLSGEGGIENEINEVVWPLMSRFRLAEWEALPCIPLTYICCTKQRHYLSTSLNKCHLLARYIAFWREGLYVCSIWVNTEFYSRVTVPGHYLNDHCFTKTSALITAAQNSSDCILKMRKEATVSKSMLHSRMPLNECDTIFSTGTSVPCLT